MTSSRATIGVARDHEGRRIAARKSLRAGRWSERDCSVLGLGRPRLRRWSLLASASQPCALASYAPRPAVPGKCL